MSFQTRKSHAREGARMIERTIDAAMVTVAAEKDAELAERKAVYAKSVALVPFTEAEYKAARVVRDRFGWHKVVRVNAKSITVETGYSWTDRIDRAKVIEVR